MKKTRPSFVIIGGGTGSYVVLSGLKHYPIELVAVVSVADSGGSTGRLRSEFGFLPVGDIRQCLAALTSESEQELVRRLLLYRFSRGEGLKGHNLGNLIMTALTDITGSEPKAIEAASRIFRLTGMVLPVSLDKVDLVATYQDGTRIVGEHEIDEPPHQGGKQIMELSTLKPNKINPQVRKALLQSDLIVFCPGDLYTSILPNLLVEGIREPLRQAKAPLVYVVNLMTRYSQTHRFTASDHVSEIEKYSGRKLDRLLVNKAPIPNQALELYAEERGFPVVDDLGDDPRVIRADLLSHKLVEKQKGDVLQRSLIRHDSSKLAAVLWDCYHKMHDPGLLP